MSFAAAPVSPPGRQTKAVGPFKVAAHGVVAVKKNNKRSKTNSYSEVSGGAGRGVGFFAPENWPPCVPRQTKISFRGPPPPLLGVEVSDGANVKGTTAAVVLFFSMISSR